MEISTSTYSHTATYLYTYILYIYIYVFININGGSGGLLPWSPWLRSRSQGAPAAELLELLSRISRKCTPGPIEPLIIGFVGALLGSLGLEGSILSPVIEHGPRKVPRCRTLTILDMDLEWPIKIPYYRTLGVLNMGLEKILCSR